MSARQPAFRILLIDDHRLVAEGISSLLMDSTFVSAIGGEPDIDSVFSVQQATDLLERGEQYQLVLLDLSMPSLNGFDFLRYIKQQAISTPIVVLSASDNTPDMQMAYNLGARGYICKFEPSNEMLRKLKVVVGGENSFPDNFMAQLSLSPVDEPDKNLTTRQLEVLSMIAEGKSNKQISMLLGVSEATVKFHISELFKQLNVRNRTLCIREAVKRGIIDY